MLIARIPKLFGRLFRRLVWSFPGEEKVIYLTFDDGPTCGVTEWVLDQLDLHEAKATFFCLGKNVAEHPELFRKMKENGHAVGNHSWSHAKGFRCSVGSYMQNVGKADELIGSKLFRPPYGRIRPVQVRKLIKEYRIIMWSVLSVDYNRKISSETVKKNVLRNVFPGAIVVFHDSEKASRHLYNVLPEILKVLKEEGYDFRAIGD